jgi:hypothetical protein
MKTKTRIAKKMFNHSGSSFDSFLEEEGIREEAEAVAIKRVLAWQLEQANHDSSMVRSVEARYYDWAGVARSLTA